MQSYEVHGPMQTVQAGCQPDVFSRLRHISEPYFFFGEISVYRDDLWTVLATKEHVKRDGFEEFIVQPKGEPEAQYLVSDSQKTVICIAPGGAHWQSQNLHRQIRNILRLELAQIGALLFHGGMIEYKNQGIILLGPSRSGKTSLILSCLKNLQQVRYVANDEITLTTDNSSTEGHGWPRSVSVRLDTLSKLGFDLYQNIHSTLRHPANETILTLQQEGVEEHGTALFYPDEIASTFDCDILRRTRASVGIFPMFNNGLRESRFQKINSSEAFGLLNRSLVSPPVRYCDFLVELFPIQNTVRRLTYIDHLSKTMPFFWFEFSFDRLVEHTYQLSQFLEDLHSGEPK